MEPWILDKIRQEREAKSRRTEVQPQLPLPPPFHPATPEPEREPEKSTIVDFEIKF